MFLLKAVGPLVVAADRVWHFPPGVMSQFRHAWGGFTLWDIIMPLFIFMCGAAIDRQKGEMRWRSASVSF